MELKIAADRVRHQVPAAKPVGNRVALPVDQHQSFGFADWQRVQDHLIDERIDCGRRANAGGKRQHGRDGERAAAQKGPRGEPEVVHEVAQPSRQPHVADFLPHLRQAAELQRRLPSRFQLGHARPGEVADSPVHVIAQFAIEILLQAVATEPVQQSLHVRLPSLKIKRTAPASRIQLSFSMPSCFRPAGVRE